MSHSRGRDDRESLGNGPVVRLQARGVAGDRSRRLERRRQYVEQMVATARRPGMSREVIAIETQETSARGETG